MRAEAVSFRAKNGRDYTFLFDFGARCAAEELARAPFHKVVQGVFEELHSCLGALICGGLKRHHPDITPEDAIELMDAEGKELADAMWRALRSALPQRLGAEVADDSAGNPPTNSTTGTPSSRPGAKKDSARTSSGGKPRAASKPRSGGGQKGTANG